MAVPLLLELVLQEIERLHTRLDALQPPQANGTNGGGTPAKEPARRRRTST